MRLQAKLYERKQSFLSSGTATPEMIAKHSGSCSPVGEGSHSQLKRHPDPGSTIFVSLQLAIEVAGCPLKVSVLVPWSIIYH